MAWYIQVRVHVMTTTYVDECGFFLVHVFVSLFMLWIRRPFLFLIFYGIALGLRTAGSE